MAVMHKNFFKCLKLVLLTLLFLGARITLAAEGHTESHLEGPTVHQCRSHIEAALKTFITTRPHEEPQSTLQDQPQTESGPLTDNEQTDQITEKTDEATDATAATEATQDEDDEVTKSEEGEKLLKEGDQSETQAATDGDTAEGDTEDNDATEATQDDETGDGDKTEMEGAGEDEDEDDDDDTETGEESVKEQMEADQSEGTEGDETEAKAADEETETGDEDDDDEATEAGEGTADATKTVEGTDEDTEATGEAGDEETAEGDTAEATEAEEGTEVTETGEDTKAEDEEEETEDEKTEAEGETGDEDETEAGETEDEGKTEAGGETDEEETAKDEGSADEETEASLAETEKTTAEGDDEEETATDGEGGETAAETEQAEGETEATEAEPDESDDEPTQAEDDQESAEEEETDKGDDTVVESEAEDETGGESETEQPEVEEEETEADDDEEEEETEEDLIQYRSREHITQILGLDEVAMAKTIATEKFVQNTLKELKRMYESAIKPMENLYKFKDISNRYVGDAELYSKPMILFIGPWSSGKSAIINYFLDTEETPMALRTGAEPQSNGFTVLMYGETEQQMDGIEVAADWTFSSLQKFGQHFQSRLLGVKLPNNLLRKVTIVDTPGIIENRKQMERSYPFNDACQWFIDRADIIYVVFDPTKLDMGLEMEALFDQLKGREAHVRIILNKADSVKPQELMRVQSTLLWNLSPLLGSSEPPIIYVGTLWARPYLPDAPATLFEAQESALLQDLRQTIDGRVENKISFTRRHAVRVRNHAKMVDCYLDRYYNHKTFFSNKKKIADEITENPQNYHIYEGLSTLTNVSRYDLPDPDIYRDFFKVNPLYEFKLLASTCSYFKGCPLDKLDMAISYDLPELMGKYRKLIGATAQHERS